MHIIIKSYGVWQSPFLFGAIRNYSELFGIIRDYSELFGTIRNYSGLFGTIRDYSELFGTIRNYRRMGVRGGEGGFTAGSKPTEGSTSDRTADVFE